MLVDDIMFTENGASVMCVPITIVDDLVPENCAEVFGVTVTSDDVRVNDAPGMAMIQIDDDDGKGMDGATCTPYGREGAISFHSNMLIHTISPLQKLSFALSMTRQ